MRSSGWFLDSACTNHVCADKKLFINFKEIKPLPIELGEGISSIQEIGEVRLQVVSPTGVQQTATLTNVGYAPNFKRNLISLSKIDKKGYKFLGSDNKLKVFKDKLNNCAMYGILEDTHGLYELVGRALPTDQSITVTNVSVVVKDSQSQSIHNEAYLHLRVPGSLTYVHIPPAGRKAKHTARACKGILVGYAIFTRGYRIWDPERDQVRESKHVKIFENVGCTNFNNVNADGTLVVDNDSKRKEADDDVYYAAQSVDSISDDSDSDGDDDTGQGPIPQTPTTTSTQHASTPTQSTTRHVPMQETPLCDRVSTRRKTRKQASPVLEKKVVTSFEVPNMEGWRKDVVTRQKGVTKSDKDTYFFDHKGKGPLRSYIDIEKHCESIRVPFVKQNFVFESRKAKVEKPVEKPVSEP
uniref:MBD domain-containing protein n=1 Tax=Strigamia maritima TaxID=126957 RepID=T1J179_STRMM